MLYQKKNINKKVKKEKNENKVKKNYYSAKSYAIFFLAKREYSQKELYTKMKQKEYPEDEIQEALEWIIENNYQSDERYAIAKTKYRANSDGNLKLKQALQEKGISESNIKTAISQIPIEKDRAIQVMEKFINNKHIEGLPDIKMKEKIYRHLLSRGFSYDSINYAYKEIFS